MSKQAVGFVWCKADKPHPTKSTRMTGQNTDHMVKSKAQANPFSISSSSQKNVKALKCVKAVNESFGSESSETLASGTSDDYSNEPESSSSRQVVSMKDLCNEDKQRIANLIKELARIGDEKTKLEQSLENERKQKDLEVKEALLQQEALLVEKEKLLNKFAKTQEKLEQLKRSQKQNLKLAKAQALETINTQSLKNTLLPGPVIKPTPQHEDIESKSDAQVNKSTKDDRFNPHKSSTPRDLSPVQDQLSVRETVTLDKHEDDLKRIELMKQRMELMAEQQSLTELMEKQELMLKEKQEQILLQQKLHRERLEQLNVVRNEQVDCLNEACALSKFQASETRSNSNLQHSSIIPTLTLHENVMEKNQYTVVEPPYQQHQIDPLNHENFQMRVNNQNHLVSPLNNQYKGDLRSNGNLQMLVDNQNHLVNPLTNQYQSDPRNHENLQMRVDNQNHMTSPINNTQYQSDDYNNFQTYHQQSQSNMKNTMQPATTNYHRIQQQQHQLNPTNNFSPSYFYNQSSASMNQLGPNPDLNQISQQTFGPSAPANSFRVQYTESNNDQFTCQVNQINPKQSNNQARSMIPTVNHQTYYDSQQQFNQYHCQKPQIPDQVGRDHVNHDMSGKFKQLSLQQKAASGAVRRDDQRSGGRGYGVAHETEDIEESKLIEDLFFIK